MYIAVITLFPEMFTALTELGVTGRAVKENLLKVGLFNPRDFAKDKHRTVDDRPYGGGPGMVMTCQPLSDAVNAAKDWIGHSRSHVQKGKDVSSVENENTPTSKRPIKVVYMSPQGQVFNHDLVNETLKSRCDLIFIAGRYEGVDERFIELEVEEEWTIGDYVLSGGELPAMVVMDALIRHIPGALGHAESAEQDSFVEGLLDYPHYTRPEIYKGQQVPQVLLSGDHKKIADWRKEQATLRTTIRRPDLLD